MNYRILIADDDKDFLEMLERYLKSAGFDVFGCHNAKIAYSQLIKANPDLILTDVEMPGINGFEFLKMIRDNPKFSITPVIMMSGKKISEIDMIEGYQNGSDDYIVKPFSMHVLSAKIKALLKRAYPERDKKGNIVSIKGLKLSLDDRKAFVGNKELKLTKKEFDIILLLSISKGKIISKEKMLDSIWGYQSGDPHTLEAHISSLRKKLGSKGNMIKNVSGQGYILDV